MSVFLSHLTHKWPLNYRQKSAVCSEMSTGTARTICLTDTSTTS